jgi:DNA repair exonuclease SbcCD ATPase subunit
LDNTLPPFHSRLAALQNQISNAIQTRERVRPSALQTKSEDLLNQTNKIVRTRLAELADTLASKQQQAVIDWIQSQLQELQQSKITPEKILQLEQKLGAVSSTNDSIQELKKTLNEIKDHQAEKEKNQQKLKDKLSALTDKLEKIHEEQTTTASQQPSKKTKPKKQKKGQPKADKPAEVDRQTRIDELKRSIEVMEEEILPRLSELKEEVVESELDVSLAVQQQAKAADLLESLKVTICWYNKLA